MLTKIFFSFHRILGTILSILFLIWFLSGFVMIYHTFPKVSNRDTYKNMDVLQGDILSVDSIIKKSDNTITKLALQSYANKPFFVVSSGSNNRIFADSSMQTVPSPTYQQIKEYAQRWNDAEIVQVDTLRELDQWIPFGRLKKEFPIYKFYFGDEDKHELYVSSQTGTALQFTDKNNRFWAWLGAIPHWVYFTSLRQNSQLWIDVVVWLSGIGSLMCLAGIILGVRSYIVQYRRRKKLKTPYKKFIYKWHHILGFIFGIFVFTFVFSGMMSLAPVPQWIVKVHNSDIEKKLYAQEPIKLQNYILDYHRIFDKYPDEVKSVEWASFGNKPIYKVVINNRLITIDASSEEIKDLSLNEQDIKERLELVHSEPVTVSLMTGYDNYYVGLSDHLPLPVYKAEVDDADGSTYYINPKNGNTRYFNTNTKVRRWSYQALHSFKFKLTAENKILWNIIMWTTMIGGTIVSLSGVWLGFRYLKRKVKKLKKYICSNKHN
ncbi:MAG: PepSY domain-containing protein [Dysgonomonas sp.]